VERGLWQLEQDRNCFPRNLVIVCSKENNMCEQIINGPELSGLDPLVDNRI
jgi:hypothetical protein